MHHTLSVLVENSPGVLARVAGLFSRRGFNIESLAVGPTEQEDRSRITLRVDASQHSIDQVIKQLYKLINVLKVNEMTSDDAIEREMMIVRVTAQPAERADLIRLAEVFSARVCDVGPTSLMFECLEHPDKLLRVRGDPEAVRHQGGRPHRARRDAQVRRPSAHAAAACACSPSRTEPSAPERETGRLPRCQSSTTSRTAISPSCPAARSPSRLRLAGPRPRAEPEGVGASTSRSASAPARTGGSAPRRTAGRRRRRPTPWRAPT